MVGAPLATTNAAIEIKRIWDMDTVAAQEHPAVQVHPRHLRQTYVGFLRISEGNTYPQMHAQAAPSTHLAPTAASSAN